ncbi:hypothetical protein CEE55_22380 [Stenotrophomonas pavanii]|uniref:Uncharacterized protein n=1 Tax=Stenotrophomonas pavanii TaxID=487698 RepID=A0A246KQK2_9GAMM|nr:hypothetical protein [Stenotrophomonas pavanii]OWR25632.1 hypothetical protein CEE55_22380 [Stenotrophomonas pavanii]
MEQLENAVRTLCEDDILQDLMIRALIATHPKPAEVKAAFQLLLSHHQANAADYGFASGSSAESIRELEAPILEKAQRWMTYFPGGS